jgi:hypothetical protein
MWVRVAWYKSHPNRHNYLYLPSREPQISRQKKWVILLVFTSISWILKFISEIPQSNKHFYLRHARPAICHHHVVIFPSHLLGQSPNGLAVGIIRLNKRLVAWRHHIFRTHLQCFQVTAGIWLKIFRHPVLLYPSTSTIILSLIGRHTNSEIANMLNYTLIHVYKVADAILQNRYNQFLMRIA